jgi:hypothetical protein
MIAIDPGAGGGIAYIDADGTVQALPMPEGMTTQMDFLRSLLRDIGKVNVYVENVGGYMPGNSGPAACKFARHVGHIEAACYGFGFPLVYVAPNTWMKSIGTFSKDKKERKAQIKESMARLYPHLSVTLKTADALGILTWAKAKHNNFPSHGAAGTKANNANQ